jgi:hypothetical protein
MVPSGVHVEIDDDETRLSAVGWLFMAEVFAIFANVLLLDADGKALNAKEEERRAVMCQAVLRSDPAAEPPLEEREVRLY